MIALIDGDLICYRSSASCEPTKVKADREPCEIAIARADEAMRRILYETGAETYKCFIGGTDNFRYKIDPMYKANRADTIKPAWLQPVREFLVTEWNATIVNGKEADDALGIEQCAGEDTCIVSIDKDLKMIPGRHYNFVTCEYDHVSPRQGWINFYTQLIMGDRSDNIMGFDGKMRQKVPQFLQPYIDALHACQDATDMFGVVREIYELGDEALLKNGQLLYIQRKENDEWTFPIS